MGVKYSFPGHSNIILSLLYADLFINPIVFSGFLQGEKAILSREYYYILLNLLIFCGEGTF